MDFFKGLTVLKYILCLSLTWEISATSSGAAAVLFRWKQIISSMRLSRSSLPLNPCNQHHVHHPTPPSFLGLKLIEFIIRLVHIIKNNRVPTIFYVKVLDGQALYSKVCLKICTSILSNLKQYCLKTLDYWNKTTQLFNIIFNDCK